MTDVIVIYLLVVSVGFALFAAALAALVWMVRSGQMEDLETPALRMLHDDSIPAPRKEPEHG
jgi:cbb3-type cytochrome oxidase maturation protein